MHGCEHAYCELKYNSNWAWSLATCDVFWVMELEMEDVGKDLAERSASSSAASQRDQDQDQAAENGGSAIEREEGEKLLTSDNDGKTSYIDHKNYL